jgi:DNA repair protein RadC
MYKVTLTDAQRFERYRSVIIDLLATDSFQKPDVFKNLLNEKGVFIGRIINQLVRDGYLTKSGLKTNPRYSWSAKKEAFDVGRWIDQHIFTLAVKRSPSFDRPRERLLRSGPSKLKTSELLAILIRSGMQGESALQAGEKLAGIYGDDLERLSLQAKGELKQVSKALGMTAYCQIMAGLELGKRLADQRLAESKPDQKITNTADTLAFCSQHFMRLARESKQEEFHVVLLDGKNNFIKSEQITIGLINESLAHPREVLRPAIRESACAMILVHNHPNGDPTPSQDDKIITRELKKAAETLGIRILDHVVIAKDRILSMVEERIL